MPVAEQPVDALVNVIGTSAEVNRVPGSPPTAVVHASVGNVNPVSGSVTVKFCVPVPVVMRLGDGISVRPIIVNRMLPSPSGPMPWRPKGHAPHP